MFDPWKDPDDIPPGNALQLIPRESQPAILLVIFIHGFKGDDQSFGAFPERLRHILSESSPNTVIECIPFPAYETKGELIEAVARFVEWLTLLTVEKEQGTAGKARIALCGHSMGGLLAADGLLELARSLRGGRSSSLWPNIVACISFDTPYLGLHPFVFKNGVTKAAEAVTTAQTIGSTIFGALAGLSASKAAEKASSPPPSPQDSKPGWSRWITPAAYAVSGAVLAGAAVGSAWYKREDLGQGYQWATDHMKYIGNLWDEKSLQKRVDDLVELEKSHGILFRNLYALLPPSPPQHMSTRTFIRLPKLYTEAAGSFLPAKNGIAMDEIRAHTGIFAAGTNDGYYELGLEAAKLVQQAVTSSLKGYSYG